MEPAESDTEDTEDTEEIKTEPEDFTSDVLTETPPTPDEEGPKEESKIPVKVLTQEDVDSGKYTIYDIVMPLPGFTIQYPPNMKDYYEMLLQKDGLTLELKHKQK